MAKAGKQSWELGMVRALVEHSGESVKQAEGEVLAEIEVNHNRDSSLDGGCLQGIVEDLREEEHELAGVRQGELPQLGGHCQPHWDTF